MRRIRIGKHAPCMCGSGLKFKDCCGLKPAPSFPGPPRREEDAPPKLRALLQSLRRTGQLQPALVPSVLHNGKRWYLVGNRLYYRSPQETFHEFLFALLQLTLGKHWYEGQLKLPDQQQHQIIKWYRALANHVNSVLADPANRGGEHYGAKPTGDVQSLAVLAFDVMHLLHARILPRIIVERLKSHKNFQGARCEIAAAAISVRAGLRVKFLSEKSKKHCDLMAEDPSSRKRIAVEAKSRHRSGTLGQPGTMEPDQAIKGDIENLLNQAFDQNPGDCPFIIFVDVNVPPSQGIPFSQRRWFQDVWTMMQSLNTPTPATPDEFSAIIVTNISYHWDSTSSARGIEAVQIVSNHPKHEIPLDVLSRISEAVQNYGLIPKAI